MNDCYANYAAQTARNFQKASRVNRSGASTSIMSRVLTFLKQNSWRPHAGAEVFGTTLVGNRSLSFHDIVEARRKLVASSFVLTAGGGTRTTEVSIICTAAS